MTHSGYWLSLLEKKRGACGDTKHPRNLVPTCTQLLFLHSSCPPHILRESVVYIYYLIKPNLKKIIKASPEHKLHYLNSHHAKIFKICKIMFLQNS